MKQVKISSFFTKMSGEAVKRKLEDQPLPSSSFQKAKVEAVPRKRKLLKPLLKGKQGKDKENGVRKLADAFTVATPAQKSVLAPKTPDTNVTVKRSPEKGGDSNAEAFDSFDDFLSDSEEDSWHVVKSELLLDRPVRCEVLRFTLTNHPKCEQIVLVRAEGSEKRGIFKLRDMWTFLSLEVNGIITVKAHVENCDWVVNAKNGYVVLNPDVMMPITSLVNGMYCLRRGILSSIYKNINQNSRQMLFGRLIHDWVQQLLSKKLDTEEDISKVLETIITSKSYLKDFYLCGYEMQDVSLDSSTFISKISSFISSYIKGESTFDTRNFKGIITNVLDIEETVASPKLGIQGRVDVTVEVQVEGQRKKVMPLELKTGRASLSREHKIQVIVYALLMDEIVRNVESGLLLYLKDGIMEEVVPEFSEVRNLLMLRNEFVKYVKDEEICSLPEPIRSSSCSKCPHSRICLSYLKRDGMDTLPLNHPIKSVDFPDLKQSHAEYFTSWTRMLYREYKHQRETVVDGLTLEGDVSRDVDGFRHTFRSDKVEKMETGTFVDIRTSSRIVGRGKVVDVTDTGYAVVLSKKVENFRGPYKIMQTKSSLLHISLTNLAYLMEGEYEKLRNLIIDREAPRFDDKIAKKITDEDCRELLRPLNREQQRAILRSAACRDFFLIKGPPGTGKTETIVALIKFLHSRNQRVLIAGHTHSSIDNILLRLKDVDFVRFGSLSSVEKKLHPRCFSRLVENCSTTEDIKKLYDCKVIASTCWGLDLDMLGRVTVDVCVIDESSQVMQAEAIRPLLFCKKFVLVGDSDQLPPVVRSAEARSMGMDVSIFERLEREECTACLTRQYRMNKVLNNLANELTYGGRLRCGSDAVAEATLKIGELSEQKEWIREILSDDINMSLVFVDTSAYFDGKSLPKSSHTNAVESGLVARLAKSLIEGGVREEDIGVISPFCDQVRILIRQLNGVGISRVEVSTVDQYQGRDKEVIFFSCSKVSRGSSGGSGHVLSDKRRLTVAVTRAKTKLVILGDMKSMSSYEPMKKLMSCLNVNQVVRLNSGEKDFFWHDFE